MSHVLQLAYTQFYSTRIALLKVYNDVILNIDTCRVTTIYLLLLILLVIICSLNACQCDMAYLAES